MSLDASEPPVLTQHNGFEIYPMPMFALLQSPHVEALAAWYQAALGFALLMRAERPDGRAALVHLRRHKYQDILIVPAPAVNAAEATALEALCLQCGDAAERLAARAVSVAPLGRSSVQAPHDTPWNTRQVRITDPEGRRLVFSEPRIGPRVDRAGQLESAIDWRGT